MSPEPAQTTRLLRAAANGDDLAGEQLLPLVYEELRSIAARMARGERKLTLQPTELIHEAYLRLVEGDDDPGWEGRRHFQRVAAKAMRFVLVDRARARSARKRGGGQRQVTLATRDVATTTDADNVLFVHEGLDRLRSVDPELAEVVELRFFAGMSVEATAQVLGVSESTVKRAWRVARLWWLDEFGDEAPDP